MFNILLTASFLLKRRRSNNTGSGPTLVRRRSVNLHCDLTRYAARKHQTSMQECRSTQWISILWAI